ncbi:hypothetical protein SLA2020_510570 [Shorea laevis]
MVSCKAFALPFLLPAAATQALRGRSKKRRPQLWSSGKGAILFHFASLPFDYCGAEGQCVQNSLCKGRTCLAAPSAIR